jgi:hypothetical protein
VKGADEARFEVLRAERWAVRPRHGPYLRFGSRDAATAFLRRWFGSPASLRRLRGEMAACGERSLDRMSDDDLLRRAALLLVAGGLRVAQRPALRGGLGERAPEARAEEDSALGPLPETDLAWIEFEAFDDLGKPLASEPYELVVPDGSTRKGTLDGNGFARVEPIDRGVCEIRFPRRDQLDWDLSLERYDRTRPTWIEIELLDADGTPCPEEPFVIHCADGRKIDGALDEKGQARVEDLIADECSVEFTRRDWRDLEIAPR